MIHITDFNGDIIDFISKSDGAVTEAEHMINVEDKLETFDFTVLTSRTEHMQKRNRVIIEDKDGQYREFIIYNISSDLNGYTRVQTNASALEDVKTAKPVAPNKLNKYTVKQALEYALADTGWEVSDEAEWGGTRTTSWTGWHDRISILKQLETTYDMRLSFHVEVGSNKITNRYVSLNKVEPMFEGEEIVYGDNMIDLKRTVDFSDIATALICLGPEDSETGKREIVEVKDDDAQAQFGLPYRYIWDIYEPQSNDEDMTKERLTTLGRTALNKRKQESISYEIDGIGLSASAGDMIRVKNEDFTPELYVDAEVVEVTTDLISGESQYKFGVIKEYTRDDVYARFNAMLSGLRERLNKVVENTDSIISERLEEELKYVERYIEKSPTPPLNPEEGQLWLDTSHDGAAVLKRYENGEWIKSSVDDVKDIGGMTREETMYEALKERSARNEVDYSEVFKRHGALVSEKHYHYVDEDIKNDLTNRYNALQQSYNDFKIAFNNINAEQPTIGLITTAISRAVEFEARLKEYNDSYYIARKLFDEVIALLQSQYSEEKFNEAMEEVASAIGGTFDGTNIIADIPNQEDLKALNEDIKAYLNGEIDSLDGKLGKQIETVVNQAKDEFSVDLSSIEKKVTGLNDELDTVTQEVSKNNTSIGLLENEISLKADSNTVKQMLDSELNAVKSSVQTNQAELKLLSDQLSSKVEKSEYTTDIDGITRDIKNAQTEREQLSDRINQTVSVSEYLNGTENLLLNSKERSDWYGATNYQRIEYDLSMPLVAGETYTISFKLKGDYEGIPQIRIFPQQPNSVSTVVDIVNGYGTATWKATDKATKVLIYRGLNGSTSLNENKDFSILKAKMERGSFATPYEKSPEDIDKTLTKHETEIEQNKLGIGTKVSYTEMNGTNKTLEKLLTEFSQTADGFNFRIDSNGMIQDLTFDRNAFKLNSNLIEFNDGDVVIKNGKTSIKQSFIDDLEVTKMKSIDDNSKLRLAGGNLRLEHSDGRVTTLSNDGLHSYDSFNRLEFRLDKDFMQTGATGTSTSNMYVGARSGYEVRFVDATQLPSDGLISSYTYVDARGKYGYFDGVAPNQGTHLWLGADGEVRISNKGFTTYNTLRSAGIYVDFLEQNTLGNNATNFYIRPSGNGEVRFTKAGSTTDYADIRALWIYSPGIRTTTGKDLLLGADREVVAQGVGGVGYRSFRGMDMNLHGHITHNSDGGWFYIGAGSTNGVRFMNNSYTSYKNIQFQEFKAWSAESAKTEIEKWDLNVLDIIKDELQLYKYKFKQNVGSEYSKFSHGIILRNNPNEDEFPVEWRDEDSFNGNEVLWWAMKGVQELAHENDELKSEIKELNNKINKIMEMIA